MSYGICHSVVSRTGSPVKQPKASPSAATHYSPDADLGYTWDMRKFITPALLFAASFVLYLLTLAPTVVTIFDDSLEMQLAVPTLSILHPTGYPLYELLAWGLTRLSFLGDAAYRVNLFSALAAAVAVALLYLVARRLGAATFPAIAAALLLAVSPVWWSQSTIAEVYAFQGAITLFVLYAFLRWGQDLTQRRKGAEDEKEKWLMLGALGVGMGFAHHRLTFLLLPGLLVYIFLVDRSLFLSPRRWITPLIALALPLLTYALLPMRAHVGSLDGSYQQIGFWGWIAGGGYGSAFILGNPFHIDRPVAYLLTVARIQFGWLGIAMILLSLPWWIKHPRRATLLALIALADLAFAAIYKVQDIEVFLIPLFIVMALWIALGLDVIWRGVQKLTSGDDDAKADRRFMKLGLAAVAILILTWPAVALAANWDEQNRSAPPARAWGVHDYGIDLLQSAGPEGHVIGLLGEMTLMRYFQYDRGLGVGVQTLAADRDAERMTGIEQSLADGMATFTTHPLNGLPERHPLSVSGPLIRVWPQSPQPPEPEHVLNERLLPEVSLTGWRTILREPPSGPSLRVMLWWRADETPPDFKISARLLRADGGLIVQQDAWPVHNAYPPALWRPGETVLDGYDLALPQVPDADTVLLIILYNPADGAELARWQTTLPPMR